MVIDIALAIGMVIALLLLIGVIDALRSPRKTALPTASWADNAGLDLEDRLRKITLSALKPDEEGEGVTAASLRIDRVGPTPQRDGSGLRPQTGISSSTLRGDVASRATGPGEPPQSPRQVALPTTRLALPGSNTVRPLETPEPSNNSEGLNPLAARYRSVESPMANTPSPTRSSPPSSKRLELPGTVASETSVGASPLGEGQLVARGGLPELRSPSERLQLPGTVADTLTKPASERFQLPGTVADSYPLPSLELPPATPSSRPSATQPAAPEREPLRSYEAPSSATLDAGIPAPRSLPPPSPFGDPGIPPPGRPFDTGVPAAAPPPVRRRELPGSVVGQGEAAAGIPAPLDIRAILRGEGAPPVGASSPLTLPGFAFEPPVMPRKPTFTTGPLHPAVVQGAPLGSVPFDPNLLNVREPSPSQRLAEPGRNALQPSPASPFIGLDLGGPASYEDSGAERVAANGRLIDLDATRIVEDFDLPDTGFETHVFSTSELIESESLGFPAFPPLPAQQASTPFEPLPVPAAPAAMPVAKAMAPAAPVDKTPPERVSNRMALSLAAQEQARQHVIELAALVDVVFVKLIDTEGSVLLSAGNEDGDVQIDKHISGMLSTVLLETQQLDLGPCSSISVEAPTAALLICPVAAGCSLAILLGSPTRLGLLRRQVRKPLASLKALIAESGVS